MRATTGRLGTLCAAAVLTLGWGAQEARADLQSDILKAVNAPGAEAKAAALTSLARANATDNDRFIQIVAYAAGQASDEQAPGFAGALAAACGASPGNADSLTSVVMSSFISTHPTVSGDVFSAVTGAGCPVQTAAAALQTSLRSAAGQTLSRVAVLPPNTPGTGVNLLQNPGNVKERGFTTRLGSQSPGNIFTALGRTPGGGTPNGGTPGVTGGPPGPTGPSGPGGPTLSGGPPGPLVQLPPTGERPVSSAFPTD
jgi:hypothetical protein